MGGRRVNDAVFQYMERITSEIVEESGNPGDKYHLGKLVLKGLKDYPQAVCQIDGATGESETNGSVLSRSTRMASCMRTFGIKSGDVIVLMAPNHMDVCVPYYAALYLGVIVSAVDRTLALRELKATFEISKPKVIFCHSDKAPEIQLALNELDMDSQIVTFDGGDYLLGFEDFMTMHSEDDYSEENFQVSEFDTADTTAFLIATSGTTGLPKAAAVTHKNAAIAGPYLWCKHSNFPTPTALAMICSPLQWLTALMNFLLSPIFTYTRLQTSSPTDQQHFYDLINKYRPTWAVFSPTMLASLVKMPDRLQCDFTCFETILLGGSAVSVELIKILKEITPAEVNDVFGMSELAGVALMADQSSPPGSSGKPLYYLQYRLMSLDNGEEIFEPYVPGELWLRGQGIFKEYYNNPEATQETFSDDRWFRTGDLFYRDSAYNYFYVERIKLMLKYKSYQISPIELENLIRSHADVVDVAVTAVPDPECGDLAVACVVRRTGSGLTAQEIKELVRGSYVRAVEIQEFIMGGRRLNDAVFQYMDRITSEIVKESGNSWDEYHLGKLLLKGLKDYPQAICQIDGATGELETNGSVLSRSTRMASCMRNFGLNRGDVIALMAPNHMDVCVPYYAAIYLGVIFSAVDRTLTLRDLKATFEVSKPKVIFCQSDKAPEIQLVLNQLNMDSLIVTFDGGSKFFSFKNFMSKYGEDNFSEETFRYVSVLVL